MVWGKRFFLAFICIFMLDGAVNAATRASAYMNTNAYNNLYPYMNNKMRTELNPGVSPSQTTNQVDVLTRTVAPQNTGGATSRRVVSRGATTSARSATKTAATAGISNSGAGTARRVVARSGASGNNATAARSSVRTSAASTTTGRTVRARSSNRNNTSSTAVRGNSSNVISATSDIHVSQARCLADYTECMNGYCQRADTAYNRCYCSARLAQIDGKYQPVIDNLIQQILKAKGTSSWSDAEMNDYWMSVIGKYTGENTWERLDQALDIDWASMESRVRGQNAFVTGHEYCAQHLRGCYYMAVNMRDVYRSEIARDCASYEQSLQKLQNAAESILGAYK